MSDEIKAHFGTPSYSRLFQEVRGVLQARGPQARSVRLTALQDHERTALADLFGWSRLPDVDTRIELAKLDAALRATRFGIALHELLQIMGGPLRDLRSDKAAAQAQADELWRQAFMHPVVQRRPELSTWLADVRGLALMQRAAKRAGKDLSEFMGSVLTMVGDLPADPATSLSTLAARWTGDAHALDPGRPLSTLLLRAAARLTGLEHVPTNARERRELWAQVGVHCDALSCQVLVHGLRAHGDCLLGRQLNEASDAMRPRRVTLHELLLDKLSIVRAQQLFVCENPAVVAAAVEQGLPAQGNALLCTEGIPSSAVTTLLDRVQEAEVPIWVHADFDWAGLRIAGMILARYTQARPWRLSAPDYQKAVAGLAPNTLAELDGAAGISPWDQALAQVMAAQRTAIYEEQVVADLLLDLAGAKSVN